MYTSVIVARCPWASSILLVAGLNRRAVVLRAAIIVWCKMIVGEERKGVEIVYEAKWWLTAGFVMVVRRS